jgi:hypothetical protein
MQHKQYQTYDQDNVNESGGYVKSEKSKQPKHDQNCGEYPKHVFISLHLSTRTSAISFLPSALVPSCVRENNPPLQISHREDRRLSHCEHLRFLILLFRRDTIGSSNLAYSARTNKQQESATRRVRKVLLSPL